MAVIPEPTLLGRTWDAFLVLFCKLIIWGFIGLWLFLGVSFVDIGVHRGKDNVFFMGAVFIILFPWILTKVQRIKL